MSKMLTVYDDVDPLNNVVSALTLDIDEIFLSITMKFLNGILTISAKSSAAIVM